VVSVRQEHSKKPAIVRDKIVELFGDIPRIELFARETCNGWDSFGDQIGDKTVAL
jgi:N6-adenosine-specific RNA methylase IME4